MSRQKGVHAAEIIGDQARRRGLPCDPPDYWPEALRAAWVAGWHDGRYEDRGLADDIAAMLMAGWRLAATYGPDRSFVAYGIDGMMTSRSLVDLVRGARAVGAVK